MTAKVKVPNYTDEQTAAIRAAYVAESTRATVDALAAKFGKSARSIIAKLSNEGVYKAAEKAQAGKAGLKKDEHADAIGAILRMTEAETESLTKANKTALVKIFEALANSKPLENGEGPEDSAD